LRHLFIVTLLLFSPFISAQNTPLVTIGWIEPVRILPEKFDIQAKIDTGADNSSLDVTRWEVFKKDNKEWVRFEAINNQNDTITLERPLQGHSRIKEKSTGSVKRPYINLWLCLGERPVLAKVNLSYRKKFKYRMLIGRNILKGNFLVNSATTFTQSSKCSTFR